MSQATSAVVTVGKGRGFVVSCGHNRLVLTAAHCLPFFPRPHGASHLGERTYKKLLSSLGDKPAVRAECLFADPIADIAVLGSPDNQVLSDEAEEYEALVESTTPLSISDAPEKGRAWMLSLAGEWFQCTVHYMKRVDGPLYVSDSSQPVIDGMSGSPILSDDHDAIGMVCLGSSLSGSKNPRLVRDLPGWLHEQQSKVKYSCPECGLNAWTKPDVSLVCGECHQPMEAE